MNVYPIIKLDSNYFFAFNQLKFDLQVLHFSLTGLLSLLGLVSNSEIVNFRARDISRYKYFKVYCVLECLKLQVFFKK